MPDTLQQVLELLRRHDEAAVGLARQAGGDFPRAANAALGGMDTESRELAAEAVAANGGGGAGSVLLAMTGDTEPQVAAAAAHGLAALKNPPAAPDILAVIPKRHEPVVRGLLYRLVGRVGPVGELDGMRAALALEKDAEAGEEGQAAAVRLGGVPERRAFLERIRKATPDTAVRVCDQVRYTEQKALVKGMLPWLADRREVMRLGSDRHIRMARMCDLAVWTAQQMGVALQPKQAAMDLFPDPVLEQARQAIAALPE